MPRLKVMTLNLDRFRDEWPSRRDRLLAVLQNEEVDVIFLQEVWEWPLRANPAAEIAQMTGYAMAYVHAHRYLLWPSIANGLAILSRFPLANPMVLEVHPPTGLMPEGSRERRIAQRIEVSLDGMSVVLYNTQFPEPARARRAAALRLWGQVGQEEAVLIVVGGGLASRPEEEPMTFLQGKTALDGVRGALVDAWGIAGIGPAETYPSDEPMARLDYVLYQAEPSVIVQESRVIGRYPVHFGSHAAIVTTFSISPTRDPQMPFEEEPVGAVEPGGGGFFGGLY